MENLIDKAKTAAGIGDKGKAHKSVAERVQAGATPPPVTVEPVKETRGPGLYFARNISSSIGDHKAGSRVPKELPEDEVREFRKKHYIEEVK
jgi:hypothetical protein